MKVTWVLDLDHRDRAQMRDVLSRLVFRVRGHRPLPLGRWCLADKDGHIADVLRRTTRVPAADGQWSPQNGRGSATAVAHPRPRRRRAPFQTGSSISLEPCDVRCASCHRRRTAQQLGWWSAVPDDVDRHAAALTRLRAVLG